jgi:excisionase family DNA binding protein
VDEALDFQETIDKWLRVVYSNQYRLMSRLYPQAIQPLTIEQLREGPLGQDLARLAALARGEVREAKERVLEAIDSVLQILFWPPAAEDYTVPRSFWETDLGRMISMAKFRAYEPTELVSIGSAAQQLGVTRPTIYRWMDDRTLGYVRDEMSGRTFVVRADVENLRRSMETMGSEA